MISWERLRPIIEDLTKERDDVADIVEKIRDMDEDYPDVDALNADWQARYDALKTEWTDRYRKAVFRGEIEDVADAASTKEVINQQEDMSTPETFDDLFSEQEVIK